MKSGTDLFFYRRLAAGVIFLLMTLWVCFSDRSQVLDNDNYIRYFSDDGQLVRFFDGLSEGDLLLGVAKFVLDEFVWQCYSVVLSYLSAPSFSVYATVVLVDSAVFYALWRSGAGLLGLMLWLLLPVCFSMIGYFQIRQGLAVAVFFIGLVWGGAAWLLAMIAAMIHTTFVIPVFIVFFGLIPWFKNRLVLRYFLMLVVFVVICVFAGGMLGDFGGRRAEIYGQGDGATSINYLLGVVGLSIVSLVVVVRGVGEFGVVPVSVAQIHLGVVVWLVVAFFIFPLGTSRVGYYSQVFSIIPAGILFGRRDLFSLSAMVSYVLSCGVLMYGGIRDGSYSQVIFGS